MQSDGNMILVGIKNNEKLRDQPDSSHASVKPFFADNNAALLQVFQIDIHEFLARLTKRGTYLEELGNVCLTLKTVLKLIGPRFLLSDGAIKIYAYTPLPVSLQRRLRPMTVCSQPPVERIEDL